jgi:hypothetical protein
MLARLSYVFSVLCCIGWVALVLAIGYFWPGTIFLGVIE